VGIWLDLGKFQCPDTVASQTYKEEKYSKQKTVVSNSIDNEGFFAGIGGRILFIPETYEEVGS